MNRKTKLDPSGGFRLYQMVANGDADLGYRRRYEAIS
jgi:hypothetical protein